MINSQNPVNGYVPFTPAQQPEDAEKKQEQQAVPQPQTPYAFQQPFQAAPQPQTPYAFPQSAGSNPAPQPQTPYAYAQNAAPEQQMQQPVYFGAPMVANEKKEEEKQ
jgi:hypothetical protein